MGAYVTVHQVGTLDPGSVVRFSDADRALGIDPERLLALGAIRPAAPEDGEPVPYQRPALPVGPDGVPYAFVPHVLSTRDQSLVEQITAAQSVRADASETPTKGKRQKKAVAALPE